MVGHCDLHVSMRYIEVERLRWECGGSEDLYMRRQQERSITFARRLQELFDVSITSMCLP
jgi:hypothetical protein